MQVDTDRKAIEAALFADHHSDDEIIQLLDRGFDWYNDDAEALVADVAYFFEQSMDPSTRSQRIMDPPIMDPARATVIAAVTACAIRMHPKVENAPPEKIQLVQYVRQYHTEMLLGIVTQVSPQTTGELLDELYKAEIDHERPRPMKGASALEKRPDEHPEFDWFVEIPLAAASEICQARFHNGSWGGEYNPDTNEVVGEPNYHIENNCIYVPMKHGQALLAERQKEVFERLVDVTWNSVPEEQFQYTYNEAEVIKSTIEDLIRHGEQEDLWTDWDPQRNLLRLVRNAAKEADDLDATEFNQAEDYHEAIQNYDADGFGEERAERKISSIRSLANSLVEIARSDEYRAVEYQTFDGDRYSEYSVGRGSGNYKQITVDDLDDIFELPCFQNMIEALKLDNGGPVRKDLYNFVRMVFWLEGYHDLPESQREDAVVDDIHELFESKWDWYDKDTTDYQARYELRHGEINGNAPLPMHCDNHDMQRHCIGKSFCPYDIYQSLPFPEAMFDQLDDTEESGQYQA
ncbi:primase-associated protein (plasmid) [Haloarcula marismortui]|uniref:primase-associated protein n=1 Tax=Haloarcula marismortui TaxID=2238 RepID=UPI003C729011